MLPWLPLVLLPQDALKLEIKPSQVSPGESTLKVGQQWTLHQFTCVQHITVTNLYIQVHIHSPGNMCHHAKHCVCILCVTTKCQPHLACTIPLCEYRCTQLHISVQYICHLTFDMYYNTSVYVRISLLYCYHRLNIRRLLLFS